MIATLRRAGRPLAGLLSWRIAGYVVSVAVIVISATVVYRILSKLSLADVVAAFARTQPHDLLRAGLCLVGVFLMLTLYDFFALRTIGRKNVPYRVAALSGFASFSIGHNIGAVLLASAAIRYRIYSARGLSVTDVAKICFVTGLTFWLGNACILGLAVAVDPSAASLINHLAPEFNRALGIGALIAVFLYVIWIWRKPRTIGRNGWRLTLPGPWLTLFQIGLGVVDLTLCSLAMYYLIPNEPHIEFLSLVVVFVSATLLGFLSHAPSGLGVFDATMLVALNQFAPADIVASLLLFRLMYYILPLCAAILFLLSRELLSASRREA